MGNGFEVGDLALLALTPIRTSGILYDGRPIAVNRAIRVLLDLMPVDASLPTREELYL